MRSAGYQRGKEPFSNRFFIWVLGWKGEKAISFGGVSAMVLLGEYLNGGRILATTRAIQHELRGMRVGRLLGAERRHALRVKCYDLAKWTFETESMNHRISNLQDISSTGLRFNTHEPIQISAKIRMILNIAEKGRQIPVLGEVVWSCSIGEGAYQSGVHFLEISEEDRAALRELVLFAEKVRS
jgi:hypothetical protein